MAAKTWTSGLQSRFADLEAKVEALADGAIDTDTVNADTVNATTIEAGDIRLTGTGGSILSVGAAGSETATVSNAGAIVAASITAGVPGGATGASLAGDVVTAETLSGHLLDTDFVTPVNALAGTALVTYQNGTNVTANKVITIGGVTYTFKAALTPAEGEVLIGASSDVTMTHLKDAVNHTGTPGTDYSVAASNPDVVAGIDVGSDELTLAARTKGSAGNSLALTTDEATFTLSGFSTTPTGVDGTVGAKGDVRFDAGFVYLCTAANTASGANWKRAALTTF